MSYKKQVIIVGAGISGLTCAFRLKQSGFHPLVLERTGRPGGLIASIHKNGFLFETGPQCPRFPPAAWRLVRELKLDAEFIPGAPRPKRYVFRYGKLHSAPLSPLGLITTGLVGAAAKLRIFADAFGSSHPPNHEETLAQFVERKFGTEILDNVVDPIIATVFLSDANHMGMDSALPALVEFERQHGSVIRGAIRARSQKRKVLTIPNESSRTTQPGGLYVTDALPSLGSFRSGMAALPERLAEELGECIRYRSEIASITPEQGKNAGWRISLSSGEEIETEHLVLAVPAYEAAKHLHDSYPQLAGQLSAIEYAPAYVIGLAFSRSQVGHSLAGFGFMVPRREGLNTICTFWNSSLFPQRAPAGQVILTTFARNLQDWSSNSLTLLAQRIEAENSGVLGISGVPLDRMIWTDPRAMPQYVVGHAKRVSQIRSDLAAIPNLHLIGSYLKGRSIGDCIEIAENTAKEVAASLTNIPGAELVCRS